MPTENTLVTIAFSHYCEKARWALDLAGIPYREDKHLPLMHLAFTRPRGGRSTPLLALTDGTVLTDSTDILDWVDAASTANGASPIWPTDRETAATARTVETQLDERFGPHARRLGYWHLLGAPPQLLLDFARVAPRAEQMVLRVFRPLVVAFIRRSLKIDEAEAPIIRLIHDLYHQLGSIRAVAEEAEDLGYRTRARPSVPLHVPRR